MLDFPNVTPGWFNIVNLRYLIRLLVDTSEFVYIESNIKRIRNLANRLNGLSLSERTCNINKETFTIWAQGSQNYAWIEGDQKTT